MPKWNDVKVVSELEKIIQQINHFPSQKELFDLGRNDLLGGISKNGGLNRFRLLMGYKVIKLQMYWTEDKIIEELKNINQQIGHFPLYEELRQMGKGGLARAISKHGGINKFCELFGISYKQVPDGYWTEEKCISELLKVIDILGHFPIQNDFKILNRIDLLGGINTNGGLNKFKEILGYKFDKLPNGYWTENKLVDELTKITNELGYFPSQLTLSCIGRTDILNATKKYGGLVYFRDILGYHLDKASSSRYNIKRGKNTENLIYTIIYDYCTKRNLNKPKKNVKLCNRNIIEFICNTNKKIGIDVTVTHSHTVITRKWRIKEYHKHLDELWIIVVSNTFNNKHFAKWNKESPDNVYIMTIEEFCNELQHDLDETLKNKINKYKSCTFHTKNNE